METIYIYFSQLKHFGKVELGDHQGALTALLTSLIINLDFLHVVLHEVINNLFPA